MAESERQIISSEKQIRDLSGLLEVSKALAMEKDLRALMRLIVDETTKIMEADRTSLFLADLEKNELYTWITDQLEIKEIRLPIGKGISGSVAKTREVVNIPDAYADSRFDQTWDKKTGYRTRTILCVPLLTPQDKLVGVIQVLNKARGVFTEYDVSLLQGMAAHAAIALDNAFLVEQYLEKQKMQQAMEVARNIQRRLLPSEDPRVEGFDVAGWSQACDETGGDYYDFIDLGESRLGVVVGDATGHGIGPALLMTGGRAFLRATLSVGLDIEEMLAKTNDLLEHDVEGGRFMTLIYCVLDPATGALRYASAGHDPMMVYRRSADTFEERDSTGLPLGIMEGMDFPEGEPVKFDPGDIAVLSTDGIDEAMDEARETFGVERFREVIRRNCDLPAKEIIEKVHQSVLEFSGDAPQRDDLTVVVIKCL